MSKIGRNKPCPCGSGKKYKKCCGQPGSEKKLPPDFEEFLRQMGAFSMTGEDVHGMKFDKVRYDLEAVFTAYCAEDVMLTLGVSDLWLPNISSQIKHLFAFGIFASISPDRFNSNSQIESYEEFCVVLKRIHDLLPAFPTLEDYVPVADWGEVRSYWRGQALRLFYGQPLERAPDYVEAFRFTNAHKPTALRDMYIAILLQDRILTSIDKSLVGDAHGISAGHIEIPSEQFWQVCRLALLSFESNFAEHMQLSPELVMDLGKLKFPKSRSAFANAVMTGEVLPALFVRIGESIFPVAPRNAVINIVDLWGHRAQAEPFGGHRSFTQQVSNFLASRLNYHTICKGPCRVYDKNKGLDVPFAAVLRSDQGLYFVITLHEKELDRLPEIETDLHDFVTNSPDWGIKTDGSSHGLQFRRTDGGTFKSGEIVILAVLAQGSAEGSRMNLPKTMSAQVLPIADLVSIFDSIKDLSEFNRFWDYFKANQSAIRSGFLSLTDQFSAFRYSHGVLVDGAIQPDFVMLDPHGGSNWRYEELAKFWNMAPACFPDYEPRGWVIETAENGVLALNSRAQPVQTWVTTVAGCTLLFLHNMQLDLDSLDVRVLGLFAHCVADAIYRRRDDIKTASLFRRRRIIVEVRPNMEALASGPQVNDSDLPLLEGWKQIDDGSDEESVSVCVSINLSHALAQFQDPNDNSFEFDSACSIVGELSAFLGDPVDAAMIQKMQSAPLGKPRFMLIRLPQKVDVPEFLDPHKPELAMYKLARKAIAVIFKEHDIEPGRYELSDAKKLIDLARDAFRDQLHQQIGNFEKGRVLSYCIAQHDAWTAKFQQTQTRLQYSLKHEVSYDRSKAFADAQQDFIKESRNLRYLLECTLSLPFTKDLVPSDDDILQLVAHVDWLWVLYSASDVLHNGIDTGGIEIDDQFVPSVFYSDGRAKQEEAFSREQANYSLGIDLIPSVDVKPLSADNGLKADLDAAFFRDTQFNFSHMMDALSVLSQWQSVQARSDFELSYRATKTEIVGKLRSVIEEISADEVDRIISFLTLDPTEIRRLIGKDVDEGDVPIWEHNKRGGRYTIKPLVPLEHDLLVWGAASTDKARDIWAASIANGYLPADYFWPSVQETVRTIKQAIEKGLERQAFEIVSKYAPFVVPGIDFMRRFPMEKFDDVGDFDVLAYWPQEGKWMVCECKYNQPPFCLKDARRLRERIFGVLPSHGQFAKIEARRAFLGENMDRLRKLLEWPAPTQAAAVSVDEIYISREIYWWMRFPPYKVPTQFVRIDYLNTWLKEQSYSSTE